MMAEEFRALRKAADYKAVDLAEALDLNPATLSRYERGHAPIPRIVELATRYLCERNLEPPSPEERLITAIREVAQG